MWRAPEVVRQVIAIATLVWVGLVLTIERLDIPKNKKILTSATTAVLGLAWFAVLIALGIKCVFCAAADSFPRIPVVLVFVFVGYFLAFRANLTQEILRAMPPYWLLGFQFFRIIG